LTTIHEPASGLERPDTWRVSIARVSKPFDSWKYDVLNTERTGTVEYVDPSTYRVLRKLDVTHNGIIQTDYDDFRTIAGYTIPFHTHEDNGVNRLTSESQIVSFDVRPVTDDELAIPPSRQFVTFPAGQTQVELPSEFVDRQQVIILNGRPTQGEDLGVSAVLIHANVGDRGVDFVLDSGASGIVIDENVVRELGLREFAQQSQVTAGRYTAAAARVPVIQIGGLEMHDVAVTSLPFSYDADARHKAVGLLGYDFIRAVGLTIDYGRRKVIAMPAGTVTPPVMTPESDILPIRLGNHVPEVTAAINGSIAERMVIDTGWQGDMGIFDFFSRRYPEAFSAKVAARQENAAASGVGGHVQSEVYRLSNVDVGRYHFKQFDVTRVTSLRSYEQPVDGVIGVGILRHFAVTFDYAGGKMYLVHNEGQ